MAQFRHDRGDLASVAVTVKGLIPREDATNAAINRQM